MSPTGWPERAEAFGRTLRYVMEREEVRQIDISNALGVARATVSGWYNGEIVPSRKNVERLASRLKVNPEYLLGTDPTGSMPVDRSPEFLRVYGQLLELERLPAKVRKERLDDVVEFVKYVRNRVTTPTDRSDE